MSPAKTIAKYIVDQLKERPEEIAAAAMKKCVKDGLKVGESTDLKSSILVDRWSAVIEPEDENFVQYLFMMIATDSWDSPDGADVYLTLSAISGYDADDSDFPEDAVPLMQYLRNHLISTINLVSSLENK